MKTETVTKKWSDSYQGKTILVSGARGYLGSAIVNALSSIPCRLILLSHRDWKEPCLNIGRAEYAVIQGNVSKRNTWLQGLAGVDYVFHFAANEHKHGSEYNPTLDLEVNALSVLHLLEVCRQERLAPKIIFASSSNLIGFPSKLPVNESFPDDPMTVYAIHKLTAERYLHYYAQQFQLWTTTLRLSNVYGPVLDCTVMTRVVLNRIIRKAVCGEPLVLFENQACIRDYVFVDDVVAAFLAAGTINNLDNGRYFIIGSGVGCRIMDAVNLIADRVESRLGFRPIIKVDTTVTIESIERRNFIADITRFSKATGWGPEVSLVEGIDKTIDSFLNESDTKKK